ncbi:MAG: extracellular solute-binding protein [Anaerolineae bacterium]|nr:extracellular solute-binding protein [Anaerolineae bacterium]
MLGSRSPRRLLLHTALLLALVLSLASNITKSDAQDKIFLNVYDNGDTNITDWWAKTIIPAFEKANPKYKINYFIARSGNGIQNIIDRALAALQTGADPQVDMFSGVPGDYPDALKAGLFLEVNEKNVPLLKTVLPGAQLSPFGLPYRGSQVLLAYDSTRIKDSDVPRTFPDLIKWIKANPGEFVYCRPDKGGSGRLFVARAIYEVTGKDPSKFTADKVDQELVKQYPKAWDLLRDIHTSIYDNGSYPAGNTPTLQLLANGSVSMITAWSDQSLQALRNGQLPKTIKLAQLTDLPFPGGYAYQIIPKNAKNQEGALALANFLLTPEVQASAVTVIGGFPAVAWDVLPKEMQTEFNSVIAKSIPVWPEGQYQPAATKGWYENVATNIKQDS